jgi:hypothetical protein
VRHWTLDRADLAAIHRRRGDHNQLGFALQLCALRYPGRLLRPGELIPARPCALSPPARRGAGGARRLCRPVPDPLRAARRPARSVRLHRAGTAAAARILAWLLPVALATTGAPAIARLLMDETAPRRVIAPGPSIIERLVAAALVLAERRVAQPAHPRPDPGPGRGAGRAAPAQGGHVD